MLNDNAGISLNRVDKSQVAVSVSSLSFVAAFAVEAERGFINKAYFIKDSYDRLNCFGAKDFRKYGTSLHSLDKYLEARCPAYVVRAGDPTWKVASLLISESTDPDAYSAETTYAEGDKVTYNNVVYISLQDDNTGHDPDESPEYWELSAKDLTTEASGQLQSALEVFSDTTEIARIFAMGEGAWGNNISVEGLPFKADVYRPGDRTRLSTINVYYGTSRVESFIVSTSTSDTDEKGAPLYFETVLQKSLYIAIKDNSEGATKKATDPALVFAKTALSGGTVLTKPTQAQFKTALAVILNYPEVYDVIIAVNAGAEIDHPDFVSLVSSNVRCAGISCAKKADALSITPSANEWVQSRGGPTDNIIGSYSSTEFTSCLFNQWVLTQEIESGLDIYIDPACYFAKNVALQALNDQFWYAPAGPRRGGLSGAKGLSRIWTGPERKILVTGQWNPIKADKDGFMFWDELTNQVYKSAYSNLHVVFAYLSMIRTIPESLKSFSFEFNDQDTIDAMIDILNDLASQYTGRNKGAEQIIVDDANNVIGSDVIKLRWNVRFKEVGREISIDIIAYPSNQSLEVSMANS